VKSIASLVRRAQKAKLPLVPFFPAIVLVIGIVTAIVVGMLGLAHLRSTSDEVAQTHASVLAATLAARLRATALQDRSDFVRRAARRTGAEVFVCTQDGTGLVDATFGPPTPSRAVQMLVEEKGFTTTRLGRSYFSTYPLGLPFQNQAVIVMVPAPEQPEGASALLRAVALLTAILLSVATTVAYFFGRDLHADVDFVRKQIEEMADPKLSPVGAPVPVRVVDQVGLLTNAFNILVDRFMAAERAYRLDLQQVASRERNRSAFLAALSHELRTPLNAILGFADVLLSEVDGPIDDDSRENLEMVRASGSHLRGLIDDILELSALESGQLRLSPAQIDLRVVAEDVMREASARLRGKNVELRVTGDPQAVVMADERRIWQILSNLVGNGIKFTESGFVQIDLHRGSSNATITVTDTGPGIPQASLEAIFDEYSQVRGIRTKERGTGLGLFIARRLVTMHGGTIKAKSVVGQGSQFIVRLPLFAARLEDADSLDIISPLIAMGLVPPDSTEGGVEQ
jgi:signal transduction histidine kinase